MNALGNKIDGWFGDRVQGYITKKIEETITGKASSEQKESKEVEEIETFDYSQAHLAPLSDKVRKQIKDDGIVDLTEMLWEASLEGNIDLSKPFCFGRDREILQISILLSAVEMPGNVIVTGPSGCGKTVLIYEIARQILMQPENNLLSKQHVLLMSTLPASTRSSSLREFAKTDGKKVILVFDECHKNLTSPIPDISLRDLLSFDLGSTTEKCKPLLAENKLSIIGLTDRLGDFLERDEAMERRFTEIQLEELGTEGTLSIIQQKGYQDKVCQTLSKRLNQPVELEIPEETIRTAIYLSMIYEKKKVALPAKAYRVLDPAAAYFFKTHPNTKQVPPEAMIDYIVDTKGERRPDVEERLEEMRELAESRISPQEPLAKYSINLSAKARRGKLAPAWGRDKLLRNIASIFGQEEFNNVLLTAPPGCGKTRVAEGLAYAIEMGAFPALKGKEVLLLNWQQTEKDLPNLLKSARKYKGQFILVIDEAHRLCGSSLDLSNGMPDLSMIGGMLSNPAGAARDLMGQAMGALDGGSKSMNDLKEAMGRGELPSLLLTTNREAAALRKDPAVMRRLEPKKLKPLTRKQIMLLLEKEIPVLAEKYGIENLSLSQKAKKAIYYLSKIYHQEEYQPSASFKVLHTVLGFARSGGIHKIEPKTVYEAVAQREGTKQKMVRQLCKKEQAADHPSSRRIPDDEPIKRFSDDWTKEARMGKFTNTIGYDSEFALMQSVLSRASCNNVLLVGKAGTGKTTLVKRLANLMSSKDEKIIPKALRNKPLFALRFSELRENKRAFAEFLESAKTYGGQYVLFIDEIHLLFQGNTSGMLSSFGLSGQLEDLKPLLAEGKITLIGATTEEDLQGVALNGAVRRRFTSIHVESPSNEDAVAMLKHTKNQLEKDLYASILQTVDFKEGAIEKAVEIADADQLPASAISILETAAIEKQTATSDDKVIDVEAKDLKAPPQSYLSELQEVDGLGAFDALKLLAGMGSLFGRARPMRSRKATRRRNTESGKGFWKSFWEGFKNMLTFIPRKLSSVRVKKASV